MKVIICSPYNGTPEEIRRNVIIARALCLMALDEGHVPFAPHLYFTQFFDESDFDQRQRGIRCGLELMLGFDLLWIYAVNGISDGMCQEACRAKKLGLDYKEIDYIPLEYLERAEALSLAGRGSV